jgi:hypothetical protein
MSTIPVPSLTPTEFLEIVRSAEFKSEYFDGEMFIMSAGLLEHALISAALVAALAAAIRGKGARATGSDLRIGVSRHGPFFHPDVTVFCGEAELSDDLKDTLLNPTVLVEVFSPSSEAYDRGRKFSAYRQIDSLRDYVLVSETEPWVEIYHRTDDDKWILSEYIGMDSVCKIESLDCEISLVEIYRDIF